MCTYDRLSDLPVEIDSYSLEPLKLQMGPKWVRHTTVVHLHGGGQEGVGEDVTYDPDSQRLFQAAGPVLKLTGRYTLESFSQHLASLELFGERLKPGYEASRNYRQWAFESAALDLALRQAGESLAGALGRRTRPVRFAASPGLGEPSSFEPIAQRLERYPDMRFKLDAKADWSDELIAQLAATKAVDVIDLKGHYVGLSVNTEPDPELYRRIVEGFPTAWIEDPATTQATRPILAPQAARITYDAPLHHASDITKMDFMPKTINVKPSRFGSLRELCAAYDFCRERSIGMYGGGQAELGVGRGQIQYLASLFHPDTCNDMAPVPYHAMRLADDLPTSPLPPTPSATGFRWGEG
jgi:L-alanine-DL-glutamate epimerase-like enolase superfamily enzyme